MNQILPPPVGRDDEDPADQAPVADGQGQWSRLARRMLGLRVVLNAMLVLAVLYTLALAHSLVIPLVLAAFVGLGLNPVVAAASTRWHVPRAVGTLVLMVALGIGMGTGVTLLTQPAANWLQRAPQALRHVAPKLKPLTSRINAASQATRSLMGDQHAPSRTSGNTQEAIFSARDVLKIAPRVLANVLAVTLLVFFFLIYGDALLRRLVEISPTFRKKRLNVTLVRNIQIQVSRYLLTTSSINASLGALTSLWLWSLGVPDPMLWGGMVALANFIPYVGAITMTSLLAVVGLLQFHDPVHGLLPAAGFACMSIVEGNFITPLILGQSMRLSPVAILIWLLIWGWMWGIPGALLAVPMLTSVKLIANQVRGWRWFSQMVER
jgi:predicted PurR-regulated permease PerM